jgi:hypothetical protein
MMQAVQSGNIAEYVEEMKAKAMRGELGGTVIVDGTPVPQASAAQPAKPDVVDLLTKLADLHDRGALTDAEFEAQKAKLLAQG